MKRSVLTAALAITAALAGCSAMPAKHVADVPGQWHAPHSGSAVASASPWWLAFADTELDAYMQSALARNAEISTAALRVQQARIRIGAATQALLPTANGSLGANAAKPAPVAGTPAPKWNDSYSASLGVGWELDLWGRLRDQRTIAQFDAEATAEDRDAVMLSITGNVARQYWQIAALQARIERADESLATAEKTLGLTKVQYRAGAISGLDLAQAEQALQQQRAARLQLDQQLTEAKNTFALLFNQAPGEFAQGQQVHWSRAVQAKVPEIPAGTPAGILVNRPDLRAANRRLESQHLNIRVVQKGFLPGISLSAGLGTGGANVGDILKTPSQSLGLGISLPFLNVGEMIRQPKLAKLDYEIGINTYRQTVLRALADVETALTAFESAKTQLTLSEESVARARRIERMNEVRYRAGATSLRLWLDAQESLRQAESSAVDARFNVLQSAANLKLALGGSAISG